MVLTGFNGLLPSFFVIQDIDHLGNHSAPSKIWVCTDNWCGVPKRLVVPVANEVDGHLGGRVPDEGFGG